VVPGGLHGLPPLPLWCPEVSTGFPLLAEGEVAALYPPNLLLYGLLPLTAAFGCATLLHTALAGAFAAMFTRQLGACRGGAMVAGFVFAFAGFFITHVKHPAMFAAGTWVPLLLLLVERYARGRGVAALVGLAATAGIVLLAGHPQIAYYALLATIGWAAYAGIRETRAAGSGLPGVVRFGAAVALALGIGGALAAPQLLPTLELNALGPRTGGLSVRSATEWENQWRHLVTFVAPKAFGDPGALEPRPSLDAATGLQETHPDTGTPLMVLKGFDPGEGARTLFWEITGYVGILPLLLAAVGGAMGWRRPGTRALLVLLAASLLLTLGTRGGLFHVFWHAVPGFQLFRFHGRFLLLVDLALAVLAGLGFSSLAARFLTTRARWFIAAATAVVCAVSFLDVHAALGDHNPTVEAARWTAPPPSAAAILARETGSHEPFRLMETDPSRPAFANAYFRARGWKGDLSPYDVAHNALEPNLNVLYGLSNLDWYAPIFPRWLKEATELAYAAPGGGPAEPGVVNARVASLFNVRYVLHPHGRPQPPFVPLAEYPGDVRYPGGVMLDPPVVNYPPLRLVLALNPWALPRAFLVPRARFVDGPGADAEIWDRLGNPEFDPRREVLITVDGSDPAAAVRSGASESITEPVTFTRYAAHEVRMTTDAPRACWLFLSDTWYPGWSATVNGASATIHRANLSGRAVRVPAGPSEIVFEYAPASFRNGLWIAALGVLALVAAGVFARRGSVAGERE